MRRWGEGYDLLRVTFASGTVLKRIGKDAFRGRDKLEELEIPEEVELMGDIGVRVRRVGKLSQCISTSYGSIARPRNLTHRKSLVKTY